MLDSGFSFPDRLLDAAEVAALLGVPRSWVYQETRAGRMPHEQDRTVAPELVAALAVLAEIVAIAWAVPPPRV